MGARWGGQKVAQLRGRELGEQNAASRARSGPNKLKSWVSWPCKNFAASAPWARNSCDFSAMPLAMSVSRPSGQVNLGVVVEPVPSQEWAEGKGQPAVLVYIRDAAGKSQASTAAAKQLFNLTRAETALAMELANGLSLEEAAEISGASAATRSTRSSASRPTSPSA